MALHQIFQRLLLIGVPLDFGPPPQMPPPPPALAPLIDSITVAHRDFDDRAVQFGHRYRSGYWAIYLLSAIAVLFAVLPLALGWDDERRLHNRIISLWPVGEVLIIITVAAIYWLGHRRDWQGQWLHARTTAELTWYLPLVAPLVDFTAINGSANWYLRVFDPGQHLRGAGEVEALCRTHEDLARERLESAWFDPDFMALYASWTVGILEGQRHYHHRVAARQHALLHRVHGMNTWLFTLTAIGACLHLIMHMLWLSLITTFFPALGASMHGALAQSEAYRLSVTSERLVGELTGAMAQISGVLERARSPADGTAEAPGLMHPTELKAAIQAAVALILEEHQDWHMLVRPHRLPLA